MTNVVEHYFISSCFICLTRFRPPKRSNLLISAGAISSFVTRHPTIKILALSFLLLIGMSLAMEGLHQPIPKDYIYFAMAFSIFVEMINLRVRAQKPTEPIQLRQHYTAENISVE